MTIEIRLPALSPTMSEGVLLHWHKNVGDTVSVGDVIAEIETDKVTVDYESVDAGMLTHRLVNEGATVQVHDVIAVLKTGSDTELIREPASEPEPEVTHASRSVKPALEIGNHRVLASPIARRLARELTVDLSRVRGTGPNGRIVKSDIFAAGSGSTGASASRGVELSSIRRLIATRLQASKQTIPHFYVAGEIRIDQLLALRDEYNRSEGVRVGINDLMLKAAATATSAVSEFNVAFIDDRLVEYGTVDIGVAIATPRGLVAPVLRDLARKTVQVISAEAQLLISRARDGALKADDLHGGGLTVSNLGTNNVSAFTAIINPPQVAILALGAARSQPVVEDGKLAVGTVINVTLSADHRIIDGVVAARWMEHFKQALEQPLKLFLK